MEARSTRTRTRKYKLKREKRFISCIIIFMGIMVSVALIMALSDISVRGYEKENNMKSVCNNDIKSSSTAKNTKSSTINKNEIDKSNIKDKKYLILVNKKNNIGQEFVPDDLRIPDVAFLPSSSKQVKKMESTAAEALEKMFAAAKEQGINLLAVSGYRTYSYQEGLYNRKIAKASKEEADKYVAPPGGSEHQTGLAMDIVSDEFIFLNDSFSKTKAYKWFEKNAFKYGFIIRYPKGKEDITTYNFEPWHLRYVGRDAAGKISESGQVLEEYLESIEE